MNQKPQLHILEISVVVKKHTHCTSYYYYTPIEVECPWEECKSGMEMSTKILTPAIPLLSSSYASLALS